MSKSRSATPKLKATATNTVLRLSLDTSRPDTHDSSSTLLRSRVAEQDQPPPITTPLPLPPSDSEPGPSISLRRVAQPSPEQPPAKRRKKSSKMKSPAEAHSSPSSDSQDGLADTETSPSTQQSESQALPPKKKRTRTLTTPHQSAVLHALLAQSRFPTTAMREEVGRAIGLSARKVQIWFQNQRQKARRPRSQSDASLNRPPLQYGPYTDTSVSSGSSQYYHGADYAHLPTEEREALERRARSGIFHISDPPQAGARPLLGPGMPGGDALSRQISLLPSLTPYQPPISATSPTIPFERPSLPDIIQRPTTGGDSTRSPRPTSQQSNPEIRQHTFSRMLPPLISGTHPGHRPPSVHPIAGSSRTLPPLMHSAPSTSAGLRSPSPESALVPQSFEHPRRGHTSIPPPFTMQPAPHWDSTAMARLPRPITSSWSRPNSRGPGDFPARSTSESAEHSRISQEETTRRPDSSQRPPRSGRYDPIRDNQP